MNKKKLEKFRECFSMIDGKKTGFETEWLKKS